MSAQLMDGKALAAQKKGRHPRRGGAPWRARPGLAVVLVGENPASQIYVRGKARDCEECGIPLHGLPPARADDGERAAHADR